MASATRAAPRSVVVPGWAGAAVVFLALAAAWQWLPPALGMKPYVLPTISSIITTFQSNTGLLLPALWATAEEAFVGLLIGVAVGFAFGALCYYVHAIRAPATTLLVALTSVPLIGLAPIAVLVFGPGLWSKIVLVAFITTFSMTLYTVSGLDNCPRDEERLLLAFKASESRIFFTLRLPASLPHILTGLRFVAGQAVLMAIVGELFSAQKGIGAVILQQSSISGYDVMWAASVEGALAGLIFFLAASALSRKATRWA